MHNTAKSSDITSRDSLVGFRNGRAPDNHIRNQGDLQSDSRGLLSRRISPPSLKRKRKHTVAAKNDLKGVHGELVPVVSRPGQIGASLRYGTLELACLVCLNIAASINSLHP